MREIETAQNEDFFTRLQTDPAYRSSQDKGLNAKTKLEMQQAFTPQYIRYWEIYNQVYSKPKS